MALSALLAFLVATVIAAYKHPDNDLIFAASVLLCAFAFPLSQAHIYAIVFVPIAQLVNRLKGRYATREGILFWVGCFLIIVPLPYKSSWLFDGWRALLAYPKLYGAIGLWLICLNLMKPNPASTNFRT